MCYELTKSKMQKLDLHGINSKRGSYKITSSIKNYISIATFLQSVLKPKRSWSQKTRKWTNTYSKCSLYSCLVVCKYVEAEWSFGIQWITAESRATHWMSSTGQFTPSLPNLSRGNSSGQVVPGKLAESHPSARWKLYRCRAQNNAFSTLYYELGCELHTSAQMICVQSKLRRDWNSLAQTWRISKLKIPSCSQDIEQVENFSH